MEKTPGEMKVMTDYWAMKESQRLKKFEKGERIVEALKELVGKGLTNNNMNHILTH